MQVSRVEIFGFKSFMERLVLPLESGVTGIVGPNGCGKSNIVDAVRWVLGETRARSLRGGVLEDVIFNGTATLRPLGLAEVSLTLRSEEKDFFADLVSPTLEAELLEAEVLEEENHDSDLNDDVEKKDIAESSCESETEEPSSVVEHETPSVPGEGKPHLTVIEGNLGASNDSTSEQESEEVSTKPFSPVPDKQSGVSQAALLHRFSWLKSVSEVQVTRRLYRSGESEFFINRVPCRLKDLKELFRAVGLGARAYTIVAQGEVSRIVTAKADERRMILEEAAGVQGFRDKIAAARRRLQDTEVNLSRIEDITKEVTRQVNSLKRQASRARNRQKLKDEIQELELCLFQDSYQQFSQKLAAVQEELQRAREQESQIESRLQKEQADEHEVRSRLMSVDVEGDELRTRIDGIKEELRNRSQQRNAKTARINELKAFSLARETENKRIEERRQVLQRRLDECLQQIDHLAGEELELKQQIEEMEDSSASKLREVAEQIDQQRDQLRNKDKEIREIRDLLISKQSSLSSVEEQLQTVSPISQLRNTFSEEKADVLSELSSDAKLLADGISVPDRYARALQAVLEQRSAFLVCSDPYRIARYFSKEQKNGCEAGTALGVFRAGFKDRSERKDVPFERLLDYIDLEPGCELAASRILDNVYFAESLDQALTFFENEGGLDSELVIVTLNGEIITAYSFQSLYQEAGILQLKQKISAFERECEELGETNEALQTEKDSILSGIEELEGRQRELLKQSAESQVKVRELGNALGSIQGRAQAEKRIIDQIRRDLENIEMQFREGKLRIGEFREEQLRVQAEIDSLKPEEEQELAVRLAQLEDEYGKLDQKRKEERTRLAEISEIVGQTRKKLDLARSDLSQCVLKEQKLVLEMENLQEKVVSGYGEGAFRDLSGKEVEEFLEEQIRAEYGERLAKLKGRILREGDVDPESITRLEEEKTRQEDLISQRKDLEQAAQTLKKTIARLSNTSEERFLTTFKAVRRNFAELVPRLFGGGKASLELSDPNNPLESGLDIIARPPGKRLKSIELLSGGEKALCATALIMALFKERPSPLCVLDEVDAPLDDANLERFLKLIKEMSKTTQFVLITHNKQSMSVADTLAGVTMQEPGATRVLSVSLQEAYNQVA